MGMFLTTAGLTLLCALLCLVLIQVAKKEPTKQKESLFEKLQFT